MAGVATAPAAAAADGEPVLLGRDNEATRFTYIEVTDGGSTSEVYLGAAPEWGVFARGRTGGVIGISPEEGATGVGGEATGTGGYGVTGNATAPGGIGVFATSEAGPALVALNHQDGVTLELVPAERSGPPSSVPSGVDEYRVGSISLDERGELWMCTSSGAPGTWTRLLREDTAVGRTVAITPIRVLDTRSTGGRSPSGPVVPGQTKGPLRGGQTITLDVAGIGAIPSTASAVVGNATLINPAGTGFLRILPAGATIPACSFNFYSGRTVSNGFTSALAPNGLSAVAPVGNSVRYHLVLDIAAYIS